MNEQFTQTIEEYRKINTTVTDVLIPNMMNKMRNLFKTKERPCSDIPVLSHLIECFFQQAQKKHERGDYSGAISLYKKAADEGSQLACLILSQYYLFGVGVKRDFDQISSLIKKGGTIQDSCFALYRPFVNFVFSGKVNLDLQSDFMIEK